MVLELRFSDSRLNLLPTPPQGLLSVLLHANNHLFLPPATQQAHPTSPSGGLGEWVGQARTFGRSLVESWAPRARGASMSLELWKHLATAPMAHRARDGDARFPESRASCFTVHLVFGKGLETRSYRETTELKKESRSYSFYNLCPQWPLRPQTH